VTVYGGGSPYPPPGSGQPPYGQPGYGQAPVPPPPEKKKPRVNLTVVAAVVAVVLVVAAVVQGATVQQIGFGPFSVSFGRSDTGNGSANGSGSGNNPGSQPSGSGSASTPGGGGSDGSGSGSGNGSGTQVAGDASVTGPWKATRVSLTIVVSQVDRQSGHLRLHVEMTNTGDGEIDLPLFGNCVATDDKGTTYNADPNASSTPVFTVAGQNTVTGIIEFTPTVTAGATTLKLTFNTIFGFGSPGGSISVTGIALPQ
jgi:hypothetical protein